MTDKGKLSNQERGEKEQLEDEEKRVGSSKGEEQPLRKNETENWS